MLSPARSALLALGCLTLGIGPGVTACSSSPSADEVRRQLADDLVTETGGALDDPTASCVADGLYQAYGDHAFQAVLDAAKGPGDAPDDVRNRVIDIFAGCDAIGAIIDSGS